MIWWIKVSLYLLWFGAMYALLLRKLKAPVLKRVYLVLSPVLASMWAFIGWRIVMPVQSILPVFELPEIATGIGEMPAGGMAYSPLLWLYTAGVLAMAIRFGSGLWRIMRWKEEAQPHAKAPGVWVHPSVPGPFTFGTWVLVPAEKVDDAVLMHENVHRDRRHTLDTVFFQLLRMIFWFHPVAWLYVRWSAENQEWEVDQVVSSECNPEDYYEALRREALAKWTTALSQPFSLVTQIKNRINMMTKKQQKKEASFWSALVVAISILALPFVNQACQESKEALTDPPQQEQQVANPDEEDDASVLTDVRELDQMPEFPGGQQEMFAYMGKMLKYSEAMKSDEVEGKVLVSFVITDKGKVDDVQVIKGLHPDADANAVDVVSHMPDWVPGQKDGKYVSVEYKLPIAYRLD